MKPVAMIGIGQMGAVFAHAFLRAGYAVYPVTRATPIAEVAERLIAPQLAMVTVREEDLDGVLKAMPARWRQNVGLVQNELLPHDWLRHEIPDPTVAVVWFEKKPRSVVTPIRPTLVAGPHAAMVVDGLRAIEIPAEVIDRDEALLHALVVKNLYILTANIGGLATGAETVGALWREHREKAERVFDEVLAVQSSLADADLLREPLLREMVEAFEADPDHKARGRTAEARLGRVLAHAERLSIDVPTLRGSVRPS